MYEPSPSFASFIFLDLISPQISEHWYQVLPAVSVPYLGSPGDSARVLPVNVFFFFFFFLTPTSRHR